MSLHRLPKKLVVAMILIFACWGGQQIAIKIGNDVIAPVFQAGLRSIGATILLTVWFAFTGGAPWRSGVRWWEGAVLAILFSLDFALLFIGLDQTSASRGTILYYTGPIMIAVGAAIVLPTERIGRAGVVGLALAFFGTAAILWREGATAATSTGDILCLGAALAWAASVVLIKATRLVRISAASVLYYQLAGSAVLLPMFSLAMGEVWQIPPSPIHLFALGYQTVVVAFASYLAFFWLIKHTPAATLSTFSFIAPAVGVGLGASLLDEMLSPQFTVGAVLVLIGLVVANRAVSRENRENVRNE